MAQLVENFTGMAEVRFHIMLIVELIFPDLFYYCL